MGLSGEWHPAPDLGMCLQQILLPPVPVQEGSLQPRQLWCEVSHHRGLSPQKPALERAHDPVLVCWDSPCWAALGCTSPLVYPCLPDSPSPEPPASINKAPSPRALHCQTAGKEGEQTPFLLFPVDINPHMHKTLATCIVIVIKLMP